MCLFKDTKIHKHNRPLVAEEDIVCYKILDYWSWSDEYYTPIQGEKIPNKCIKEKVPFKAPIRNIFKFIRKHILGGSPSVEEDFIHTFIDVNKPFSERCDRVMFKCVIPKDTLYYVGTDNDYASRQIIFLEPVNIDDLGEY